MADDYEFRVERRMGPALTASFPAFSVRALPAGTVVRGRLQDGAELADLVQRLDDAGVRVTYIRRGTDPSSEG